MASPKRIDVLIIDLVSSYNECLLALPFLIPMLLQTTFLLVIGAIIISILPLMLEVLLMLLVSLMLVIVFLACFVILPVFALMVWFQSITNGMPLLPRDYIGMMSMLPVIPLMVRILAFNSAMLLLMLVLLTVPLTTPSVVALPILQTLFMMLNLKKSWHPHTIKNQERVWRAEQAEAAEKRKLAELQQEISDERNREELKRIGQTSGVLAATDEKKLEWMYKGSTDLLNREEYLLGRQVDKSFEKQDAAEREHQMVGITVPKNHVEHECIPFSLRSYQGHKGSEEQVDLQRKITEDPLMAIKQREMETRKKLLENPVKLKEIHRLLRNDGTLGKSSSTSKKKSKKSKSKKSKKKKGKSSDSNSSDSDEGKDLDAVLAKKYKKLQGDMNPDSDGSNMDINKLLTMKYNKLSEELDKMGKSKSKKKSKAKDTKSHSEDEKKKEPEKHVEKERKRDSSEAADGKKADFYRRDRSSREQTRFGSSGNSAQGRYRQRGNFGNNWGPNRNYHQRNERNWNRNWNDYGRNRSIDRQNRNRSVSRERNNRNRSTDRLRHDRSSSRSRRRSDARSGSSTRHKASERRGSNSNRSINRRKSSSNRSASPKGKEKSRSRSAEANKKRSTDPDDRRIRKERGRSAEWSSHSREFQNNRGRGRPLTSEERQRYCRSSSSDTDKGKRSTRRSRSSNRARTSGNKRNKRTTPEASSRNRELSQVSDKIAKSVSSRDRDRTNSDSVKNKLSKESSIDKNGATSSRDHTKRDKSIPVQNVKETKFSGSSAQDDSQEQNSQILKRKARDSVDRSDESAEKPKKRRSLHSSADEKDVKAKTRSSSESSEDSTTNRKKKSNMNNRNISPSARVSKTSKTRSSSTDSSSSSNSRTSSNTSRSSQAEDVKPAKNFGLVSADGTKIEIKSRGKDINKLPGPSTSTAALSRKPSVVRSEAPALTDEEKKQKLKEMLLNAAWRDDERKKNVKKYKEEEKKEQDEREQSGFDKDYINKELHKALANQKSVESRIRANINNIQRSGGAMDSNFAKR